MINGHQDVDTTICGCACTFFNLVVSQQHLMAGSGGPIIFTTLSNAILMLRVLAVYNYNRYRKWTLRNDSSV